MSSIFELSRVDVSERFIKVDISEPVTPTKLRKPNSIGPSEIVRVAIHLKNTGEVTVDGVEATLYSPYGEIRVLQGSGDYGKMEQGEEDRDTYMLETVSAAPESYELGLSVSYQTPEGEKREEEIKVPLEVSQPREEVKKMKFLVLTELPSGIPIDTLMPLMGPAHETHEKQKKAGKIECSYAMVGPKTTVTIYNVESPEELMRLLAENPLANYQDYKVYPLIELEVTRAAVPEHLMKVTKMAEKPE